MSTCKPIGLGNIGFLIDNAQNPLQTQTTLYVKSSELGLVDPLTLSL